MHRKADELSLSPERHCAHIITEPYDKYVLRGSASNSSTSGASGSDYQSSLSSKGTTVPDTYRAHIGNDHIVSSSRHDVTVHNWHAKGYDRDLRPSYGHRMNERGPFEKLKHIAQVFGDGDYATYRTPANNITGEQVLDTLPGNDDNPTRATSPLGSSGMPIPHSPSHSAPTSSPGTAQYTATDVIGAEALNYDELQRRLQGHFGGNLIRDLNETDLDAYRNCHSPGANSPNTDLGECSIDSDLLSISGDSDDPEALSLNNRIYMELITLVLGIIVEDTGKTTHGQSPARTQAELATTGSEQTRVGSSFSGLGPPGSSIKRHRTQISDEDSDEEESCQPRPKRVEKSEGGNGRRSLACPFAKMDPVKHATCFSKKLSRIRDVKQHLHRKHTPKFYCARCQAVFPNGASLQEHVGNVAGLFCEPSTWLDGISLAQRDELSRKSDPKLSEEGQWFSMWDIIFPGRDKPSSAYIVFGFSDDLCSFTEFVPSRIADAVVEALQESGFTTPSRGWDDVHRIIINTVDSNINEWRSSRLLESSASSSDASLWSPPQARRQGTHQHTPLSTESSHIELTHQGSAGESRDCPQPNMGVISHQPEMLQNAQQGQQEFNENWLEPDSIDLSWLYP
ncbi:hypothetical protein GGR52DRAFT_542137 [Hypoxylon sp. FL1284]|nr:hypothetical protein GGR52DRAFT_542137 [Hypoxylon sp. FL1284]